MPCGNYNFFFPFFMY